MHPADRIIPDAPGYETAQSEFARLDSSNASVPTQGQEEYALANRLVSGQRTCPLSEVGKALSGEIVFNQQFRRWLSEDPAHVLLVRGGNIARYVYVAKPRQGSPVYVDWEGLSRAARPGSKVFDCMQDRVAYQEVSPIDNYRRLIATFLPKGKVLAHTVSSIKDNRYDPFVTLALVNSAVLEWCFSRTSSNNHVNAYEMESLPVPQFAVLGCGESPGELAGTNQASGPAVDCGSPVEGILQSLRSGGGLIAVETRALKALAAMPPDTPVWTAEVHDALAAAARELCRLGESVEQGQSEFAQGLAGRFQCQAVDEWSGSSRLRTLDYLGWPSRYPAYRPDEATVADGRPFPNGVAPPMAGDGPGGIPWDLIARVYPSYPLPGIDAAAWEAAAWDEFCDLLRKNKGTIGSARIRADLTGAGSVRQLTGPLRQLHDTFVEYHRKVRDNRARAAEIDFLIDRIVFRLFELTPEEQKLILSRVGPGRPLPPRRGGKKKRGPRGGDGPGLFE
jgi:hypothetical protein